MGDIKLINFGGTYPDFVRICESAIEQWRFSVPLPIEALEMKYLFLVGLDDIGECHEANDFIRKHWKAYKTNGVCELTGITIALIVLSSNDLFTKTYAKKFIFLLNQMGAACIGHPLLEITSGYSNLKTWASNLALSLEETASHLIHQLVARLGEDQPRKKKHLRILVLHAGDEKRSNTLMLWKMLEEKLEKRYAHKIEIRKLHVEDGQIRDCFGCSYATCTYHALNKSCFYGGYVVEELFPEIEKADYVVWVCPNYNDALSAKLTALINRLTALYRTVSFREKHILGVVVSANSGNDTVASQLIGALCINKGFRLPPSFVMMAQANAPGDILKIKSMGEQVDQYASKLFENLDKTLE